VAVVGSPGRLRPAGLPRVRLLPLEESVGRLKTDSVSPLAVVRFFIAALNQMHENSGGTERDCKCAIREC
jgi:hypothetical protein